MYMCCYMIQYTWVFLLCSSGSSQAERNPSWPKIPLRGNHAFSLFSMDLNSPLPPKDNRRYYITARVCKVCLMILNQVDILWRCLPPNHSSWYKLLSFCFLFFCNVVMTPWFTMLSFSTRFVLHEMLQASDLAFGPLVFFAVRCLAVFPLLRACCEGRVVSTRPVPMPWPDFPIIFESLG